MTNKPLKIISMFLVTLPYSVSAQTIAVNRTVLFSYDLNGNITSRKGTPLPSKPIGGNEKIDISGDISIIGKDNKFNSQVSSKRLVTRCREVGRVFHTDIYC